MAYWCDRSLIQNPLYIAVCLRPKDFRKELKGLGIPKSEWPVFTRASATTHFISWRGKEIAIVCVGDTEGHTKHAVYGLLVHEATHIWQGIKGLIGEDAPSKEFEAYAMQWLAQELMHGYETERKRRGKCLKSKN